jgi:hypothetical protein
MLPDGACTALQHVVVLQELEGALCAALVHHARRRPHLQHNAWHEGGKQVLCICPLSTGTRVCTLHNTYANLVMSAHNSLPHFGPLFPPSRDGEYNSTAGRSIPAASDAFDHAQPR